MIRRARGVALAAALVLAACPAPRPPSSPAPRADVPPAAATLAVRGMALGLWDLAPPPAATFAELRALGVDTVSLVVRWRQRDVTSVALAPAPGVTMTDADLRTTMRRARAAGLAVVLFPIVDLEIIEPGRWRGTLAPADVDAWWGAYRGFVRHYAAIAAEEGAAAFSLGSELGSTEGWRERWWALAGEVRRTFTGTLLYSANWDHYAHVTFWDRVDVIGVSAYPPLAEGAEASVADLEARWRATRAELTRFARAHGRPLWLTEVGLPSRDGAAVAPWDYTRAGAVDLEEQRRFYVALARAWADEPALAGVIVWVWDGAGGPDDGGYTPRGKPAAGVLRRFFARAETR